MFCKFCGVEVEDDSVFCKACGKRVTEETPIAKEIEQMERKITELNSQDRKPVKKKEKFFNSAKGVLIIFLVIIVGYIGVLFIANYIVNDKQSGSVIDKVIERNLTASDYTTSRSQDLTAYSIAITPKKKITVCTVQCTLYDKNGNVLYSDTMTKTNLIKGSSYTYTFDFGFINALSGEKIKYEITGKCIG